MTASERQIQTEQQLPCTPVVAVFDVGRTNKKFFLFNESYSTVYEEIVQFDEVPDEDGFPSDDVEKLSHWVKETLRTQLQCEEVEIKAVNFSAYGASFVHVGGNGMPVAPLYNYMKPFPEAMVNGLYARYGGGQKLSLETASPLLGSLNSGLQLYRLKYEQPGVYERIVHSLHLPQYVSSLVTGKNATDMTSIGCHTLIWNFQARMYHDWVYDEELDEKFAPVLRSHAVFDIEIYGKSMRAGIGLHDSSAALIPYLASFSGPFVLISTGTWCISLHPFSSAPLSADELERDCLLYLDYKGNPVKASRLFAGHEHEEAVTELAAKFSVPRYHYKEVAFSTELYEALVKNGDDEITGGSEAGYAAAYHSLIYNIIRRQHASTSLLLKDSPVRQIFVDGGFAHNPVYMQMLAEAFPGIEVYSAEVSQATALGAALAIHSAWNTKPLGTGLVALQRYQLISG